MRVALKSLLGAFIGYLAIRLLDGFLGLDPEAFGERLRQGVA